MRWILHSSLTIILDTNVFNFWTFEHYNKYLFNKTFCMCRFFFCRLYPQTLTFCSNFEYFHSGSSSSSTTSALLPFWFARSCPRFVKRRGPQHIWEHWSELQIWMDPKSKWIPFFSPHCIPRMQTRGECAWIWLCQLARHPWIMGDD